MQRDGWMKLEGTGLSMIQNSVRIRPFNQSDVPLKVKWINDPNNNRYLHYNLPLTEEKTYQWFENLDKSKRFDATILYRGRPVGIIGVLSIENQVGEYYITIGEASTKGKGVAFEASKQLLDHAFSELGLEQIYLSTEVNNVRAQRLFEKLGFIKKELRQADIKNKGKLVDRFFYILNKEDYLEEWTFQNTPVYVLKSETKRLKNKIYIKREDLIPFSFGGNKARKAFYFLKDAKRQGANHIVTYGSSSSNHARIISNMAAQRGYACTIITPNEASDDSFNQSLVKDFGADIITVPVDQVAQTIDNLLVKLKESGVKAYFIQGGGHGYLGTKAYVDAFSEILDYEEKNNISFDYIFFASGTGSTQAGLVAAALINKRDINIIGMSIARKVSNGRPVIVDSAIDYLESSSCSNYVDNVESSVKFYDDYILDGYGSFNVAVEETIERLIRNEGIALDLTYTGKAYWAMTEYIKEQDIVDKNILFIHTGGTPLYFDYLSKKRKTDD